MDIALKSCGAALVAMACAAVPNAAAQSIQCAMVPAFDQADTDAPGGSTSVWSDSQGNLMFISPLHVNTDGTKRSYSVSDFWGEQSALNNLCNAMRDACAGLNKAEKRQRSIDTQEAARAGWPKAQLAETKLSPRIIPMPNGKPCAEVDGFLVSATALHKRRIDDVCDLSNYVDALTVPALVVPQDPVNGRSEFSKRGVGVGDLGVAMAVQSSRVVPGVVGDTGSVDKLGEASIAMNGKLLDRVGAPANYIEAKNWVGPESFVLIFAQSRNIENPYMTVARIDPEAAKQFRAWGGQPRASACIKQYKASIAKKI